MPANYLQSVAPANSFGARNLGWLGRQKAAEAFAAARHEFIRFSDTPISREPVRGQKVCLWDAAKKVLGQHVRTFKQEIGDCVSFGAANALMYLTCTQIAQGQRYAYHEVFQPFIYGASRVWVGGQHDRSDGSTGTWAAQAMMKYGALFYDDQGVPGYSGRVASDWGYDGPPDQYKQLAADNLVKSATKVESFDAVVQAITNGYPVTVASDQGFEGTNMQGRTKYDRCWEEPSGQWMHQMCIIAVDTINSEPCAFIINSWGASCWSNQPDGAPQGGFWCSGRAIERMVNQGDSYAISGFAGFPKQKINWAI